MTIHPLVLEARELINENFKKLQLEAMSTILRDIDNAEYTHKKNIEKLTNTLNMYVNAKTFSELPDRDIYPMGSISGLSTYRNG